MKPSRIVVQSTVVLILSKLEFERMKLGSATLIEDVDEDVEIEFGRTKKGAPTTTLVACKKEKDSVEELVAEGE